MMRLPLSSTTATLFVAYYLQLFIDPTNSLSLNHRHVFFKSPAPSCKRIRCTFTTLSATGADIEQEIGLPSNKSPMKKSVPGADIEQDSGLGSPAKSTATTKAQGATSTVYYRGLVNEIDYCIDPSDVSLSRAYSTSENNSNGEVGNNLTTLSLTRALNNASNRAVRRILLVRCWPSPEALNLSLRLAALAEKQALMEREASGTKSTARCPIPRPILNVLMRRDDSTVQQQAGGRGGDESSPSSVVATSGTTNSNPEQTRSRSRTNEEYVSDQIRSFRERYGSLKDYNYAEAYLESVLSLATSGEESSRVPELMESDVYAAAYGRVISVLDSAGAKLERVPETNSSSATVRIADELVDQDICLSMLDKIAINREQHQGRKRDVLQKNSLRHDDENGKEREATADARNEDSSEMIDTMKEKKSDGRKFRAGGLKFWKENRGSAKDGSEKSQPEKEAELESVSIILSPNAPTMTRQLNSLSNIVLRALLFGGDQELLVLSETLASNRKTFVERWYPGTYSCETTDGRDGQEDEDKHITAEKRPGVQYLDALVRLLRECYDNGIVTSFEPFVELIPSYSNAYERLLALTVELGSGYIRPISLTSTNVLSSMPKPRTPQEELGRFAVWESKFRSSDGGGSSYPEDLEGPWEVRDEVGGETIGISTVEFESQGTVVVAPPMQGLRWSLSPGPTHLDTCTFSVLAEDGTVLQYRGFIDRGARLEARFSRRPMKIRGSVMLQMRDGDIAEDYWKGMLPSNYQRDTTKFVMTKIK